MLSPLFDSQDFFLDDGWDMTIFNREAAALSDMAEFWADMQAEAEGLNIVQPVDSDSREDWALREEPEEHKEKLVHHDCMWTGVCGDSGHPSNTFVSAESITATPGQSLLKKIKKEPEFTVSPPRPETPPSLDEDEPPQFQHSVDVAGAALRLLRDSAAVAADHSYTLAKPALKLKFENLGVQTPSDSEEEIDVVSLGDKTVLQQPLTARADSLPRVPSAMDRHHIQRTVASAITPRQSPVGRKRLSTPSSTTSDYSPPPRKRTRGPGRRPRRSSPDSDSDGDCPDLERRSLHNDMERMRRIGLKNLFDHLKDQIPSIRDKERAPKVVILREASTLCRRLRKEQIEREQLKREQVKLMAKLKRLRTQLAAARYQTP